MDLHDAFTATTSLGLYAKPETKGDSFVFKKTGTVNVEGVPFNIVAPEKAPMNIVVLNGGHGIAKTMPKRVEAKLGGFKANRLHILGGVTGWGFQNNGDTSEVLQIIVHFTDGQREGIVCRNGTEFSDYFHRTDVPGSKWVDVLKNDHQVRYFAKQLAHTAPIDKITLESFGASAAPTIVAITAELADANAPLPTVPKPEASEPKRPRSASNPTDIAKKGSGTLVLNAATPDEDGNFKPQFSDEVPQPPAAKPANGPRVLIVGGGSSHDFVKFFGGTDKATLAPSAAGWISRRTQTASPRSSTAWTCSCGAPTSRFPPRRARR